MKYTYRYVTGESIAVEVSAELEALLKNEDRLEYNNDHANTRRHVSLDTTKEGGADFLAADDQNLQALFEGESDLVRLRQALEDLRPNQRALIHGLYLSEKPLSQAEYAAQLGIAEKSVKQSAWRTREKIKEILKKL